MESSAFIGKLSSVELLGLLGGTGYRAVAADYDGDGLADPAVKLENGNEWIVMFFSVDYAPIHMTIQFE